jgi:predicted enzyme related to lactoylglutathione lyase
MGEGRMMLCADPTGAVLGCWQPQAHLGAGIQQDVGSLRWFELMTNHTAAAKNFYTKVFVAMTAR